MSAAPAPEAASVPLPAAAPASVEGVAPTVADLPTQKGPKGILFDFNDGCRVVLPEAEQPWRVRLSDLDTGNVLFETELKAGRINSTKRYYVRFRIEVWQQGESVFAHDYSAAGRDVLVRFPVDTLGDPLGWFPYAARFKDRHGCRLTCMMNGKMSGLLRSSYPDINFLTESEIKPEGWAARCSITRIGCPATSAASGCTAPPVTSSASIRAKNRRASPLRRPIADPYVCIAVQSTLQAKYWNNPTGWAEIVRFLKESGYRVICIDLKSTHGKGLVWTQTPPGAEDQTGDQPLIERARWLKHAEFFIGLSSGLSWLAWSMRTPVVMISGVTHPINEFTTPYRVINYHACNSCWNDPLSPFDRSDFLTCPRHKDTPRQFECSRLITAEQVKQTIRRIPGFGVSRRAVA